MISLRSGFMSGSWFPNKSPRSSSFLILLCLVIMTSKFVILGFSVVSLRYLAGFLVHLDRAHHYVRLTYPLPVSVVD